MKTPKRQISFLERKEVEQIIAGIKTDSERNLRDRALIEVLFSTGLRIAECLSLQDAPFVSAPAGKTFEISIIGKGQWQRVVFFSPRAIKAVKAWLEARTDSEQELFPITVRAVQIMIKKRAKAAGIEKRVTPHIMRHSIATHLLQQGISIYYVQQFLGHRAISSTSVYLHTSNKELKDIHSKLLK